MRPSFSDEVLLEPVQPAIRPTFQSLRQSQNIEKEPPSIEF